MDTFPELLVIDEVSELTRIPVATLRYWRHQGTGPKAARLGGRLVYKKADVIGWVNQAFESAA
ncbi:AlpA family transcriptional regulator [Arthrobacter sp. M4]|uniref:helix-turn-helix transcriptional regulator n=1 Tax=Arthrobacter sp. M4 TaxID=218160 RepID=UPI001CDB6A51|nr:helix-turn-helix domain-containing protein [Arthrobacter sp. M4]MCA4132958.1 helix-turn-helix domain-containing protein [Arthrobacter sp. M4]